HAGADHGGHALEQLHVADGDHLRPAVAGDHGGDLRPPVAVQQQLDARDGGDHARDAPAGAADGRVPEADHAFRGRGDPALTRGAGRADGDPGCSHSPVRPAEGGYWSNPSSRKDRLMLKRRTLLSSFAAACCPSGDSGDSGPGGSGSSGSGAGGSTGGDKATLTSRLWDENAVAAYEESFQAFTAQSGWNVSIDVVPWGDYWTRLPLDMASGGAAAVAWVNYANHIQLEGSDARRTDNAVDADGQR